MQHLGNYNAYPTLDCSGLAGATRDPRALVAAPGSGEALPECQALDPTFTVAHGPMGFQFPTLTGVIVCVPLSGSYGAWLERA